MTTMRFLILALIFGCAVAGASPVLEHENRDLPGTAQECSAIIRQLQYENERQDQQIRELFRTVKKIIENDRIKKTKNDIYDLTSKTDDSQLDELVLNATIEERVALLEIQVVEIEEDVTGLVENVNFLFDEQVIQDERLFSLEEESDQTDEELDQVEDQIEALQDTTIDLDSRVTVLEENGGSDGNSSVSELEERVEALEETAADHETRLTSVESRITSTEGDVEDLETVTSNHEIRITAAEENIQGTIAFHAVLISYTTIPNLATVLFNETLLNEGGGYNSTSGVFTVPSGGGGLYYFSTYLSVTEAEWGHFEIEVNNMQVCHAWGDHYQGGILDEAHTSCSAVVDLEEGDEVKVRCEGASVVTSLHTDGDWMMNGFNGFRI